MGALTCHVLDTHSGRPAEGIRIELSIRDGAGWKPVVTMVTTATGRTAAPLLAGDQMIAGAYRLEFCHADYFGPKAPLSDPPFYDRVAHFFAIHSPDDHFHITMIASPWGYSTYRWKV
jgi:hydroxyisourate hydrolase